MNVIYNCDIMDGFKKVDDSSVDLIVTSPPYNVGIEYDSWNDTMPEAEYYEWCNKWLSECYRVLKSDGRICINHVISSGCGDRHSPLMRLYAMCESIGFKNHGIAIWEETQMSSRTAWGSWMSASSPYINMPYEGIIIMYKDSWKKLNKGVSTMGKKEFMDSCTGIWKIRPETKPTTKVNFPVELPLRCINMFSYKDDVVLDPFMGGGTTAVACVKSDRKYIGFEISEEYYKSAINRVAETCRNDRLLDEVITF